MLVYPLEHELDKTYIFRINEIKSPFPAHRHNFLEFSYIISGSGIEIINGKKHSLQRGTFTLLLPYQVHEIHPENNNTIRLYNCNLSLEMFFGQDKYSEELNEMIFRTDKELPPYVSFDQEEIPKIENILQDIYNESREKNIPWKDLLFKSKIIELFVLFDRKRQKHRDNGRTPGSPVQIKGKKSSRKYLWEVIYYIHKHYMEDISLTKLAGLFGVSPAHLSTSFRDYFGENIHSFINSTRIKHACALLASSDKQIIDIAAEVGFNSYTSFSRVFRQKQGISASEYKKMKNYYDQ